MITLLDPPHGLEAIIERYGNPDKNEDGVMDESFADHKLKVYSLPFTMRLAWRPEQQVKRFRAHVDVAPIIIDALKEIQKYKGAGWLDEQQYNYWGGCWWFRLKRGIGELSTHSFGIAVDLNPHLAPLGEKKHKQPEFITAAFVARGFTWGGNWARCDAQHFQAASGY